MPSLCQNCKPNEKGGAPVEDYRVLDSIDRSILRILSAYKQLTPSQIWYRFDEDDAVKIRVTEEEVLNRLESLRACGFVERVKKNENEGDSSYLGYRTKGNAYYV
jgi:DNA-binding Lrp family transcriptional regulator